MAETRADLLSLLLKLMVAFALAAATLLVFFPFLGALVWATMIVVATWPVMTRVQRLLWGRRGAAVAVMTLVLLLVLIVPLAVGLDAVLSHAGLAVEWGRQLAAEGLPPAPGWLTGLPLVGERLGASWNELAAQGREGVAAKLGPHVGAIGKWLAGHAGTFGGLLVQFLLTVVIAAILYTNGETAAKGVRAFFRRLGGDQADEAVLLAGSAIRSVAIGIVVTALAQTLLAGLGLFVAGVPFAPVLTAVVLALCMMQLGPILVLLPATVWLFWAGHPAWGTCMAVWTLAVGMLDNVLRPVLIKRGADIPLLLVFAGVLGGLLAFGPLGLFVGPVVLAVTYTLLAAWVKADPATRAAPAASGTEA